MTSKVRVDSSVLADGNDGMPRPRPSMSEVPCRKRDDYLEWPEYFMAVAFLSAQRSKDPNSQVGACIVNAENKIVGIGYNGMPNGCSDDLLPWRRTAENILDTKYPYGNSHQSAARLSLTLIQLTAGRIRSCSERHLIKSPEDWDYPLLRSC